MHKKLIKLPLTVGIVSNIFSEMRDPTSTNSIYQQSKAVIMSFRLLNGDSPIESLEFNCRVTEEGKLKAIDWKVTRNRLIKTVNGSKEIYSFS